MNKTVTTQNTINGFSIPENASFTYNTSYSEYTYKKYGTQFYMTVSLTKGDYIEDKTFTQALQEKYQLRYPNLYWDYKLKGYTINLSNRYKEFTHETALTTINEIVNVIEEHGRKMALINKDSTKKIQLDKDYTYEDDLFIVKYSPDLNTFLVGYNSFLGEEWKTFIKLSTATINTKQNPIETLPPEQQLAVNNFNANGSTAKNFFIINPAFWNQTKQIFINKLQQDLQTIEAQSPFEEEYLTYIENNEVAEITENNPLSLYIQYNPEVKAFAIRWDTSPLFNPNIKFSQSNPVLNKLNSYIFNYEDALTEHSPNFPDTTKAKGITFIDLHTKNKHLPNSKFQLVGAEHWREVVKLYNGYKHTMEQFNLYAKPITQSKIYKHQKPFKLNIGTIYFDNDQAYMLIEEKHSTKRKINETEVITKGVPISYENYKSLFYDAFNNIEPAIQNLTISYIISQQQTNQYTAKTLLEGQIEKYELNQQLKNTLTPTEEEQVFVAKTKKKHKI